MVMVGWCTDCCRWFVVGMLAYKGEAILGDTIYSKHSHKLFITITL